MLLGRRKECLTLAELVEAARSGSSGVLVLRGAAGVGKSALLAYALESASEFRFASAAGVESEMELAFAGLHQLCAPLLDGLHRLPVPQRAALETAFGLSEGPQPDGFLVGLAVLSLLSDAAREAPLLCVIDDAQWLDRASAQALALATRRLEADPVAVLFALREPSERDELVRLPELRLGGLSDAEARELLATVVTGRLDAKVAARIVAEAEGNPLALLELPRFSRPADLAGGFALASAPLSSRLEESFRRRADQLPPDTQRLLLLAAAEPIGDPAVLWRAAALLGIGPEAAAPAEDEGLFDAGTLVRFRHPLVRSAVYRESTATQRRQVHAALAEATDPELDPDRRAWHRAQAAREPDETVAAELDRSASRAQARGGPAAAAAFLERSAALSLEPTRKIERALRAAEAKYEAGAPDSALELLAIVEAGPPDELQCVRADWLRGRVARLNGRGNESAHLLLSAARRLATLDPDLARDAFLEALGAAIFAGNREGLLEVADALPLVTPSQEPRPVELLFSGWRRLITEGFPAGYEVLKQAMRALQTEPLSGKNVFLMLHFANQVARSCWDDENWDVLSSRYIQGAREATALTELPRALSDHGEFLERTGELAAATAMFEEANAIAEATGGVPRWDSPSCIAMAEEEVAIRKIDAAHREAVRAGDSDRIQSTERAAAVLYNGLGRYREALESAQRYCDRHPRGGTGQILMELVEAASRCDELELAAEALTRLRVRTQNGGTDWAFGVQACWSALLSQGQAADELYLEAIERLQRCRMKLSLARARLLYGEWLRRERRSKDAREQLRSAYEMFETMGAQSFARRARVELLANGGRPPRTRHRSTVELTSQEGLVARLASERLSNQEIAAQLFLSPYTVDYHLRKVFRKLDINGRGELSRSLLETLSTSVVSTR